ncbi:MAG TPA: glycosyltransferase family 87 protein [Ktedonobacteraceae bacterium]|nr:glycosyltransferase family 87 protein [Ktedonobacteraceae bacterium]
MSDKKTGSVLVDAHEREQKQRLVKSMSLLAQKHPHVLDVFVVAVMATLLFWGVKYQIGLFGLLTDAAHYQCYVVAFLQGTTATGQLPTHQCDFMGALGRMTVPQSVILQHMQDWHLPGWLVNFVASQSVTQPFHALPYEYPLLALVPFLFGLTGPLAWYQTTFACWMILLAIGLYFLLKRRVSRGAAIAVALYLPLGSWITLAGRFDLVPAFCTVIALFCAGRARWKWAFTFLALATMLKFYPVVLVLPFLVAQQRQSEERWYSWRRLQGLAVFALVCLGIEMASLLLNVQGTLAPLSYFDTRPIQVESFLASILWVASFFHVPMTFVYTYGSLNALSSLSAIVSLLAVLALLAGLGYTFWLQWRGKLSLVRATLLTLLIVMLTGKVFSPQYLIWVAPFVAIVGKSNWKWLVTWGIVCLLTTLIYPFVYDAAGHILLVALQPIFYPVVTLRNALILGVVIALFYQASRPEQKKAAIGEKQAVETVSDRVVAMQGG